MPDPVLDRLRQLAPPTDPPTAATRAAVRARLVERPHAAGRRRLVAVPAALVLAAPLAYLALRPSGDTTSPGTSTTARPAAPSGTPGPQWTAVALQVARAAPRLLVSGDGWAIVRADEWEPGRGELAFAQGDEELELFWAPLAERGSLPLEQMTADGKLERAGHAAVPGVGPVATYRYRGQELMIASWQDGASWLTVRGHGTGATAFAALLGRLRRVDVDTWLSAMPPTVVRPAAAQAAIAGILRGVPLPPGLTADDLDPGGVRDRYQMVAHVTGQVTCAWLDRLTAARAANDAAVEEEAASVLRGATGWPALREIDAEGGWSQATWQTIAVALDPSAAPALKAKLDYRSGLGCAAP